MEFTGHCFCAKNIAQKVKLKLIEKFKHSWSNSVFTSAKCLNYRIFKTELVLSFAT